MPWLMVPGGKRIFWGDVERLPILQQITLYTHTLQAVLNGLCGVILKRSHKVRREKWG